MFVGSGGGGASKNRALEIAVGAFGGKPSHRERTRREREGGGERERTGSKNPGQSHRTNTSPFSSWGLPLPYLTSPHLTCSAKDTTKPDQRLPQPVAAVTPTRYSRGLLRAAEATRNNPSSPPKLHTRTCATLLLLPRHRSSGVSRGLAGGSTRSCPCRPLPPLPSPLPWHGQGVQRGL